MNIGKTARRKNRTGVSISRPPLDADAQRDRRQRRFVIFLAFLALSALTTQRLAPKTESFDRDIDSESIARETILADFKFQSVDLQATKEAREAAAARVPEQYRVDRERVENQLRLLQQRIGVLQSQRDAVDRAIRAALLASNSSDDARDVVWKAVNDYTVQLTKELEFRDFTDASALAVWLLPSAGSVPEREFEKAAAKGSSGTGQRAKALREPAVTPLQFAYSDQLPPLARGGLEYVLASGILGPGVRAGALGEKEDRKILIIRDNPVGDLKYSEELPLAKGRVVSDARELLRTWIAEAAKTQLESVTLTQAGAALATGTPASLPSTSPVQLQNAAFEVGKLDVIDTLVYDPVASENAKEAARRQVASQPRTILAGQVIQRMGDPWTEQSRNDAKTYWLIKQSGQEPLTSALTSLAANMILVALILACLVKGMPLLSPKKEDSRCNLNVALLLLCATLAAGRIMSYMNPTGLLVPVAACAILLAILIGARVAVMTSLLGATLVSIQYGYDWSLLAIGSAMSCAGVFNIFRVRRRGDMAKASVKAAAVGILTVVAVSLALDSLFSETAFQRIGLITANALLCLLIVPSLLSPLEKLFGITTDIQLLEYSDLNNEVLSRLAIEVPATYSHSQVLGHLAEAAADAIGANGLLARVCAYYHDIGKMRRPEYFSENQTGVNIHEGLAPRLSARAIASHVIEGVEMAREYHLPKPIVDGILEHHGTCLISFFYQQAQSAQKHGDVREDDFRYPGPKPQSRETAILMICDAVESGVRSIKNPNEERIREFVDKIIAARSADRQFDECNLTLKDLDTIGKVVTKRMMTTLHTRIAYPDKTPEKKLANVISLSGGQE